MEQNKETKCFFSCTTTEISYTNLENILHMIKMSWTNSTQ